MKVVFLKKGEYADNRGVVVNVTADDVKNGKIFNLENADNIESYVNDGAAIIDCMLGIEKPVAPVKDEFDGIKPEQKKKGKAEK